MQFEPTRAAARARLAAFLPAAGRRYAETRNADDGPAEGGRGNVSQLSPWLHAGVLGETEVLEAVLGAHSPRAAEKFIAEVFPEDTEAIAWEIPAWLMTPRRSDQNETSLR